jgi:hypothetical protein
MALHRDIYWVGRQWAVTGSGVQAVDQRLQGAFDVEFPQLWDDGLQARMRAHAWVNAEDFDKALMLARQRFPQPAKTSPPLVESVQELIQQPAPGSSSQPPSPLSADEAGPQHVEAKASIERRQEVAPPLQFRMQGRLARFLPQWRVRP